MAGQPPSRLVYAATYNLGRVLWLLDATDRLGSAADLQSMAAAGLPDHETHAVTAIMEWRLESMAGSEQEDARRDLVRAALAASDRLDVRGRAWTRVTAALEFFRRGEFTVAYDHAQVAMRLVGHPEADGIWYPAATNAQAASRMLGQWEVSLDLARQLQGHGAMPGVRHHGMWQEASLLSERGDFEAAAQVQATLKAEVAASGDQNELDYGAHLSAIAMAVSEPARAHELLWPHLQDSGEVFGPRTAAHAGHAWSLAAELAWRDPKRDHEYIDLVRTAAASVLTGCHQCDLWHAQVEAHLARAEGRDDHKQWATIAEAWDSVEAPYEAALARLRFAEGLLEGGRRDDAAAALAAALVVAEALGARPLINDVRGLAGRGRLKLPGTAPGRPGDTGSGLTVREHEVLQLLAEGRTNDQIGGELFISPKTVSVHVSHILAKLGATNRAEVTAIAHRRGLVGD